MKERYEFQSIEEKWQRYWAERQLHRTDTDAAKQKFYCLEMFPYPSGKIHMGHVRNYAIGDVIAAIRRCAASVCSIRWDGMRSACRQRMLRSRITFTLLNGPMRISHS